MWSTAVHMTMSTWECLRMLSCVRRASCRSSGEFWSVSKTIPSGLGGVYPPMHARSTGMSLIASALSYHQRVDQINKLPRIPAETGAVHPTLAWAKRLLGKTPRIVGAVIFAFLLKADVDHSSHPSELPRQLAWHHFTAQSLWFHSLGISVLIL